MCGFGSTFGILIQIHKVPEFESILDPDPQHWLQHSAIVFRPIGDFKSSSDYQYQLLRCNVDLLKIIQLGLTFMDSRGHMPEGVTTWQFNFRSPLSHQQLFWGGGGYRVIIIFGVKYTVDPSVTKVTSSHLLIFNTES